MWNRFLALPALAAVMLAVSLSLLMSGFALAQSNDDVTWAFSWTLYKN